MRAVEKKKALVHKVTGPTTLIDGRDAAIYTVKGVVEALVDAIKARDKAVGQERGTARRSTRRPSGTRR